MIVFDLLCGSGHRFEGWFSSGSDFDKQKAKGLLGCPTCASKAIQRMPSATRFNVGAEAPKPAKVPQKPDQPQRTPEMDGKDPFAIAQMLYSRMLDEALKAEDVGTEFPSEARKIFYSQAPGRAIRGQATNEEHQELVEEGIPVARLPVPPPEKMN